MNILIITSYYPTFDIDYDDPRTKFLYYYGYEWTRLGHRVLILHSTPKYPALISSAAEKIEKLFKNRFPIKKFIQNKIAVSDAAYTYDGIEVIRTSINKYIPKGNYFAHNLKNHRKKVLSSFEGANFTPDMIFADFVTPSSYIATDIASKFKCSFNQVIHHTDFSYLEKSQRLQELVAQSKTVLFRSYPYAKAYKEKGFPCSGEDYMFSGIPNDQSIGKPRTKVKKLLYVGQLIERKKIDVTLQALAQSKGRESFTLDIIGEGACKKSLKKLCKDLRLDDRVSFYGRMPRDQIFDKMNEADCFVMVSLDTFGMVYIEALSQGCLVIATEGQGVDGIIKDKENGFLCKFKDVDSLTQAFDVIASMSEDEIHRLTENGIATARSMTDRQLAVSLLDRLTTSDNKQ